MPRKETASTQITAESQQNAVSDGIDNFELPKSLVAKIAKVPLPEHAKLQKEAGLALVKGSSVFINYLAATAHEVASSKQHKSVSASDVVRALELIEFGDIIERLQSELQVYRDLQRSSRKSGASGSTAKGKVPDPAIQTNELMGPPQSMPTPKSKGKEKAAAAAKVLPDDESRAPSPLEGQNMDVDAEMIDGEQPEDEVVEEFDPGEDPPEEEYEDEEEQEQEQELVDQEALIADELNRDARNLDQYDAPDSEA